MPSVNIDFHGLRVHCHYEETRKGGVHPDEQYDEPGEFFIEHVSYVDPVPPKRRVFLPVEFVEWLSETYRKDIEDDWRYEREAAAQAAEEAR